MLETSTPIFTPPLSYFVPMAQRQLLRSVPSALDNRVIHLEMRGGLHSIWEVAGSFELMHLRILHSQPLHSPSSIFFPLKAIWIPTDVSGLKYDPTFP